MGQETDRATGTDGAHSASADEELLAALAVAGWPASLAEDPSKRPKVLPNARALVDAVLFSSHVDEIFVLPNGVQLLGHDDVLPTHLTRALQGASSVRDFLCSIDEETLSSLRGRVYCYASDTLAGDEHELKTHEGASLDSLLDKRRALPLAHPEGNIYLAELRHREKYRHPLDGRWVKTLLARDVKDFVGRDRGNAMPYWDRYDEGVFVGARFGGSPMHVDQVSWSNVGKNFHGSKLLAVWPSGEASQTVFDAHNYRLFVPPLSPSEASALQSAARVALVRAGDLFIFSGGNAHMALSVSEELSVTAYESFLNLAPANLQLFLQSGTEQQYAQCRARQPMMDDIRLDVAESVGDLLCDIEEGYLRDGPLQSALPAALAVLRGDETISANVDAFTARSLEQNPQPPPAKQPKLRP